MNEIRRSKEGTLQQAMNADIERHRLRLIGRPHVLFVDDKPAVLSGLGAHCPLSGIAGICPSLATVPRPSHPGDTSLRCAGLRLPDAGMDGAELLMAVRDRHPGTARVMLSAYIDDIMVDIVDTLADRRPPKPCTLERIIGCVVERIGPHRRNQVPDP